MKLTEKSYRLADGQSREAALINVGRSGKLTVYDPQANNGSGARRAIRHCPNQKSIFLDEQDQFARVEPIVLKGGVIDVPSDQPMTQKFLDMHPSNLANGGSLFEVIDDEREAKDDIAEEELKMLLKSAVLTKSKEEDGIHKLSAVVAVLLNSVEEAMKMGVEQLKRELYNEIDYNPYYFTDDHGNINIFDDDEAERRYIILRAMKDQIIKPSPDGKSMRWGKDSEVIATAPVGMKLVDFFSEFLTTEEGRLVVQEIVKRS